MDDSIIVYLISSEDKKNISINFKSDKTISPYDLVESLRELIDNIDDPEKLFDDEYIECEPLH